MGTRHNRHASQHKTPCGPQSVWATGQHEPATDLIDRGYHIDTAADTDRVPPAVAERAIEAYCPPRGIVLDPDCGAGTVLAEALRDGRSAIGVTEHRRWRTLATANINAVRYAAGVGGMAFVAAAGDHALRASRAAGLTGQIDLALTSVRTHPPDNTLTTAGAKLRALLENTRPLMRPGARIAIVVPAARTDGTPAGLLRLTLDAGASVGLLPTERCVALTGRLDHGEIISHAQAPLATAAIAQRKYHRRPLIWPAHVDIAMFTVPTTAAVANTQRFPMQSTDEPRWAA
ncbi:DNA methyltransferase [Haloechinothrix salitolerans]|uniref:DNA methyltransferase n=1 Tax=Haloechinothrix salitolerans TaxID=926830 RepID=A0ABW2C6F2_9PSEU